MDDFVKLGFLVMMLLTVGTFVMLMIPVALRNFRKANMVGRETSGELEGLRSEIDELRNLPQRMAELEERLDFAERMLTQQREGARLPGGPDAAR
jgi:hypothetical protein